MNDPRDFQDAESVHSGQSTSVFPTSSNSWRNARPSYRNAEPQGRAAKHLGLAWYIGKRFCKSCRVFCSTLSAGNESMDFRHIRTDSLINGGEEWESNTSSASEMPVRTVSQKFIHPKWGSFFIESWGRPTTTSDFGSSFRQNSTHQQRLLVGSFWFKTEICTSSQFPTEPMHWIKEEEMVDSVGDL